MIMKRNILCLILLICCSFILNVDLLYSSDKPLILRAGGISPPTSDISIAMVEFTKFVEEKTKGRVKIEFYPASQLGSAPNQIENVQSGMQDIFASSISWASRQIPDFNITQYPFVFRNPEHLIKFMQSSLGLEYQKTLISKWNSRIISYNWWRLPRVIFAKKPIFKIEDLKGLKFRIPELPMYVKYVSAWGAVPTRIAWGEYYLALKQGVVDMGESCAENIYPMKFYEAAPYITMINYAYDLQYVVINEKRFQSLLPDIQKIIIDSANKAGELFTQRLKSQFEKDKTKMIEEGTAFIEINNKPFKERALSIVPDLERENFWSKGLFERVQQIN